ncbi:MAG: sugar phosphate isomerase/epimerase [Clostridia bacterium]|nr:sugar phosphate isomerase/epimerase [Clostridia bacterium]
MSNIRIFAFADESSPMIDQQIVAMHRNGLQGLEIRNVDNENVSFISLEKAKEVRKKMDDAGLITWSIGSPIGKIDIEKDDFAKHLDVFRHTLELADILGAENIRLFSFFIPEGKDPADYKNEVIDRMGAFADAAKGSNVVLCHENEKGIYGDMANRCLEVLQAVPSIKGIFDPANFVQCGQDTLQAWNLLKPYIKYMHIKDALADGNVVPAGQGIGNVKQIVGDFIANGGKEFTLEPHLAVFAGLSALERENEKSVVGHQFVYESNEQAFDAACNAFKCLL